MSEENGSGESRRPKHVTFYNHSKALKAISLHSGIASTLTPTTPCSGERTLTLKGGAGYNVTGFEARVGQIAEAGGMSGEVRRGPGTGAYLHTRDWLLLFRETIRINDPDSELLTIIDALMPGVAEKTWIEGDPRNSTSLFGFYFLGESSSFLVPGMKAINLRVGVVPFQDQTTGVVRDMRLGVRDETYRTDVKNVPANADGTPAHSAMDDAGSTIVTSDLSSVSFTYGHAQVGRTIPGKTHFAGNGKAKVSSAQTGFENVVVKHYPNVDSDGRAVPLLPWSVNQQTDQYDLNFRIKNRMGVNTPRGLFTTTSLKTGTVVRDGTVPPNLIPITQAGLPNVVTMDWSGWRPFIAVHNSRNPVDTDQMYERIITLSDGVKKIHETSVVVGELPTEVIAAGGWNVNWDALLIRSRISRTRTIGEHSTVFRLDSVLPNVHPSFEQPLTDQQIPHNLVDDVGNAVLAGRACILDKSTIFAATKIKAENFMLASSYFGKTNPYLMVPQHFSDLVPAAGAIERKQGVQRFCQNDFFFIGPTIGVPVLKDLYGDYDPAQDDLDPTNVINPLGYTPAFDDPLLEVLMTVIELCVQNATERDFRHSLNGACFKHDYCLDRQNPGDLTSIPLSADMDDFIARANEAPLATTLGFQDSRKLLTELYNGFLVFPTHPLSLHERGVSVVVSGNFQRDDLQVPNYDTRGAGLGANYPADVDSQPLGRLNSHGDISSSYSIVVDPAGDFSALPGVDRNALIVGEDVVNPERTFMIPKYPGAVHDSTWRMITDTLFYLDQPYGASQMIDPMGVGMRHLHQRMMWPWIINSGTNVARDALMIPGARASDSHNIEFVWGLCEVKTNDVIEELFGFVGHSPYVADVNDKRNDLAAFVRSRSTFRLAANGAGIADKRKRASIVFNKLPRIPYYEMSYGAASPAPELVGNQPLVPRNGLVEGLAWPPNMKRDNEETIYGLDAGIDGSDASTTNGPMSIFLYNFAKPFGAGRVRSVEDPFVETFISNLVSQIGWPNVHTEMMRVQQHFTSLNYIMPKRICFDDARPPGEYDVLASSISIYGTRLIDAEGFEAGTSPYDSRMFEGLARASGYTSVVIQEDGRMLRHSGINFLGQDLSGAVTATAVGIRGWQMSHLEIDYAAMIPQLAFTPVDRIPQEVRVSGTGPLIKQRNAGSRLSHMTVAGPLMPERDQPAQFLSGPLVIPTTGGRMRNQPCRVTQMASVANTSNAFLRSSGGVPTSDYKLMEMQFAVKLRLGQQFRVFYRHNSKWNWSEPKFGEAGQRRIGEVLSRRDDVKFTSSSKTLGVNNNGTVIGVGTAIMGGSAGTEPVLRRSQIKTDLTQRQRRASRQPVKYLTINATSGTFSGVPLQQGVLAGVPANDAPAEERSVVTPTYKIDTVRKMNTVSKYRVTFEDGMKVIPLVGIDSEPGGPSQLVNNSLRMFAGTTRLRNDTTALRLLLDSKVYKKAVERMPYGSEASTGRVYLEREVQVVPGVAGADAVNDSTLPLRPATYINSAVGRPTIVSQGSIGTLATLRTFEQALEVDNTNSVDMCGDDWANQVNDTDLSELSLQSLTTARNAADIAIIREESRTSKGSGPQSALDTRLTNEVYIASTESSGYYVRGNNSRVGRESRQNTLGDVMRPLAGNNAQRETQKYYRVEFSSSYGKPVSNPDQNQTYANLRNRRIFDIKLRSSDTGGGRGMPN